MTRESVKTLFHPFATGVLPPMASSERVLFLGAESGFERPDGFEAQLFPVQGFRPLYRSLERAGLEPSPFVADSAYDACMIVIGRHKGQNENFIAEALRLVPMGGWIVVAGSKEDGIQSLRKRIQALGVETGHLAKYHAQAFWFARPGDCKALIAALDSPAAFVADRFVTAPGMFSHGAVDQGSAFLARYLPKDAKGNAADFCAGWGYLSAELAAVAPGLDVIDLYEADFPSLEAAKTNLKTSCPGMTARYFWHDLAQEEVKHHYDLIIMNPPFHEGHAADPALGAAMVKSAHKALKGGGSLIMVANRGLPYEPALQELFRASGETARNARFKVIWAKK
jgi:16S rRNA (guanine1207-N2)-methyltransferase